MTESREIPWDPDVFERPPRAKKIRCRQCGMTGWPDEVWTYRDGIEVGNPFWWGNAHLRGHTWACSHCPRAFVSSMGLASHERTHR